MHQARALWSVVTRAIAIASRERCASKPPLTHRLVVLLLAEKTTIFCMGVLQSINARSKETQALVLSPTRELAIQSRNVMMAFGDYMNVTCHSCVGGKSLGEDIRACRVECKSSAEARIAPSQHQEAHDARCRGSVDRHDRQQDLKVICNA